MTAVVGERRTPGFRRRVEHPDDLANLSQVLDQLVSLRHQLRVTVRGHMVLAVEVTR